MENHDCKEVLSKVFLVLDGELSSKEEKEFLAELENCSHCLDSYSIEQSFKELLKNKVERKTIAASLMANIREKVKALVSE